MLYCLQVGEQGGSVRIVKSLGNMFHYGTLSNAENTRYVYNNLSPSLDGGSNLSRSPDGI